MNSIYGITDIRVEQIVFNTNDTKTFEKVNEFLYDHDGNVINIQYVGQSLGQVAVFITYRED